jgi:hypothetical protein
LGDRERKWGHTTRVLDEPDRPKGGGIVRSGVWRGVWRRLCSVRALACETALFLPIAGSSTPSRKRTPASTLARASNPPSRRQLSCALVPSLNNIDRMLSRLTALARLLRWRIVAKPTESHWWCEYAPTARQESRRRRARLSRCLSRQSVALIYLALKLATKRSKHTEPWLWSRPSRSRSARSSTIAFQRRHALLNASVH